MTKTTQEVNEWQAKEINLWIDNTERLYNGMRQAIVNNYRKKKAKGIFDETLAVKGLKNLVREGMRDYNERFGLESELIWINDATKTAAAQMMLERMKEELEEVSA